MSLQPGFYTVWPSFLGMNSQMNADNQELSFKPISVGSSVAPVPCELVGAIANNEYIDFKLLLPSNLALLSVMPSVSTQSIARLITSNSLPYLVSEIGRRLGQSTLTLFLKLLPEICRI